MTASLRMRDSICVVEMPSFFEESFYICMFRDFTGVNDQWFHDKERSKGLPMIPLDQLTDARYGYQVDKDVFDIVAQIKVYDESRDYDMVTTIFLPTKPNDADGVPGDLVYVKGFQVLPSQVRKNKKKLNRRYHLLLFVDFLERLWYLFFWRLLKHL